MASIIKSTITENLAQAPGCGRDIRERHEWDDGTVSEVYYRAGDKHDAKAAMLARVAVLESQRVEREAREAEDAALEAKRLAALKRLPVADIADVLMVPETEAQKMKADADRATVREVSRG